MRPSEIKTLLESSGYPVTYLQWPEKEVPELPYICYYFPNSNNFGADNRVYTHVEKLNVELYTKEKDFGAEGALEDVLEDASLYWEKSESYLNSEHMYEVLYESEVVIHG